MKDFYIHTSDGKKFLIRGTNMQNIMDQIGSAKMRNNGFIEARIPVIYKYVMIGIDEITYIEEDDED